MRESLLDAVVLITSSRPDNRGFGTGFPFYRAGQTTYIATCAHVVIDVGSEFVMINEKTQASVVAIGSEGSIDIAVLCATGLSERPLLPPNAKRYQLKPLSGTFVKQTYEIGVTDARILTIWDLKIKADYYQLQGGNSGSPVVDENGSVVGIISNRQGEGDRGTAFSIEHLQDIWPETPINLLKQETAVPVENKILGPQLSRAGEDRPAKTQSHVQQMMQDYQNPLTTDIAGKSQPLPRRRPVVSQSPGVQANPSLSEDVAGNVPAMIARQLMGLGPASAKPVPLHLAGTPETTAGKREEIIPRSGGQGEPTRPPQTSGSESTFLPSHPAKANSAEEARPRISGQSGAGGGWGEEPKQGGSGSASVPTFQKGITTSFAIIAVLGVIGLIIDIVRVAQGSPPSWWIWVSCLILLFGGAFIGMSLEEMSPEKFSRMMVGIIMTVFFIFFRRWFHRPHH